MAKGTSTPTRVAADVAAAATSIAVLEHRTMAEQINHWARIGMQIERSGTLEARRILAVVAGHEQFSTLGAEERAAAHALIDADMAERVARDRFGPAARAAGQTTVSLDDNGTLIEISPDGTRRNL